MGVEHPRVQALLDRLLAATRGKSRNQAIIGVKAIRHFMRQKGCTDAQIMAAIEDFVTQIEKRNSES